MSFREEARQFIFSIESLYDGARHSQDLGLVLSLVKDRAQTGQELVDSIEGIPALGQALGLNLGALLCDASVALAVLGILQKVLRDNSTKGSNAAMPQETAHAVVDLHAGLEGARAFLLDILREAENGQALQNRGQTLARLEMLKCAIENATSSTVKALLPLHALASLAPMVDYSLKLLVGPEFAKLTGAIEQNLKDLAV